MKYDGYQVGIVIKSLRIQRNLTKEALAAELGISVSTIKKYENGERALSITNLFKIIDYFKVDANTILNVAAGKNCLLYTSYISYRFPWPFLLLYFVLVFVVHIVVTVYQRHILAKQSVVERIKIGRAHV